MKLFLFLLIFAPWILPGAGYGDDEFDSALAEFDSDTSAVDKTIAHVESKGRSLGRVGEPKLVDLDLSRAVARIEALERRVGDLERENRFLEGEIRNLDRSVDDIKRRHF